MSIPPVISIPRDPQTLKAAHDFHLANVGEFLLPRDIKKFDTLANAGELWVAKMGGGIVAACYVTRDKDDDDAEFGGVIVQTAHQHTGLASAIGTIAIGAYAVQDAAGHRLIAHVHVDNPAPIDLLTKRLGFSDLNEPIAIKKTDLEAKLGYAIPSMRAGTDGMIRGNTYGFSRTHLDVLADRLFTGRLAKVPVVIENQYFQGDALAVTVATLRELAAPASAGSGA